MTLEERDGKAKVWRCPNSRLPSWHGYVEDAESPNQSCAYCGGWDWTFPDWDLAMAYVDRVLTRWRRR